MPWVERHLLRIKHAIMAQQGGYRYGRAKEASIHGEFIIDHAIRNRHAHSLEQLLGGRRYGRGAHAFGDHAAGAWADGVLASGETLGVDLFLDLRDDTQDRAVILSHDPIRPQERWHDNHGRKWQLNLRE